jgi:hypothetical protein
MSVQTNEKVITEGAEIYCERRELIFHMFLVMPHTI